jgi:hypothetical protein
MWEMPFPALPGTGLKNLDGKIAAKNCLVELRGDEKKYSRMGCSPISPPPLFRRHECTTKEN